MKKNKQLFEKAFDVVEEVKMVMLIEDVLKRYGLIEPDFTFETVEDEVAKYRLKYQVYGERIDVYNMFFVTIKDNTEIRVREHKYRECDFDTTKEGCYSFVTIEEFKNYLKRYN